MHIGQMHAHVPKQRMIVVPVDGVPGHRKVVVHAKALIGPKPEPEGRVHLGMRSTCPLSSSVTGRLASSPNFNTTRSISGLSSKVFRVGLEHGGGFGHVLDKAVRAVANRVSPEVPVAHSRRAIAARMALRRSAAECRPAMTPLCTTNTAHFLSSSHSSSMYVSGDARKGVLRPPTRRWTNQPLELGMSRVKGMSAR